MTHKWYHYITPVIMLVGLISVYIGYNIQTSLEERELEKNIAARQEEMQRSKEFNLKIIELCDLNGNGELEEGPETDAVTAELLFNLIANSHSP